MCETNWRYELGIAWDGCKAFPTNLECMKKYCPCTNESEDGSCGIVELEITFVRFIKKDGKF